jgi:hypothetical protein
MSPDIAIGLLAAVIVVAGLASIAGALRRTSKRPAGNNSRGDGGPFVGGPADRDGRDDDGGGDDGGGGDGGGD